MESNYSEEERANLKQLFDIFDTEKTGLIDMSDMHKVLEELGKEPNDHEFASATPGKLTFDEFLYCVSAIEQEIQEDEEPAAAEPEELAPDSRVVDFLK